MENMKLLMLIEPKRTEQGLRLEGECKFCGSDLAISGADCENGYDSETHESWYCGNLCCIACGGQCQGNEVTDDLRALASLNRCIREQRPYTLLTDVTGGRTK